MQMEGEDKMEKAARKENKKSIRNCKLLHEYILEDMEKLHIDRPEIITKSNR